MSAGQFDRVTVSSDVTATGTVLVRDSLGKEREVRADLRPAGTAPPAKGQLWLLWSPPNVPRMLLAQIGHPAPPVVAGSRTGASALTLSLLDALDTLGLIKNQSTP